MAKHVESSWSAKAGEKLSFGSEFGITAGQMCFYPMVKDAKKAMDDAKAGRNSEELENTILNIVVSQVLYLFLFIQIIMAVLHMLYSMA